MHIVNGEYVMGQTDTRVEKDSLGDVAVPAYKLWVRPKGWVSRYCQSSCGKPLKSRKQKVNTEEKLALVLHRNLLLLLGKDPPR